MALMGMGHLVMVRRESLVALGLVNVGTVGMGMGMVGMGSWALAWVAMGMGSWGKAGIGSPMGVAVAAGLQQQPDHRAE